MKEIKEKKFLLRKNTYEDYRDIREPLIRLAILESLCEVGLYGEYDLSKYNFSKETESLVRALIHINVESIKSTNEFYKMCEINGAKGGDGRGNKKVRGHATS